MCAQVAAPKSIRENLSRAKAYLRRDECVRSLEVAKLALDAYAPIMAQIGREDRFNIEVSILEFVRDINKHPQVREVYLSRKITKEPFILFSRGKEKQLAMVVEALRQTISHKLQSAAQEKEEEEAKRKAAMLEMGQKLLDNGEFPRGKAVLRRYMEECDNASDVVIDVGDRLLGAKLYTEAADVYEKSIELYPKNVKGYSGAVSAYTGMHDFEKIENTYMRIIKQFGAHPKTLFNVAKFYLGFNKKEKAYDFAVRALDKDPTLVEAKEFLEKIYK